MQMSCSRSDDRPRNAASETPRKSTAPSRPPLGAKYYNRLEFNRLIRPLYAAAHSSLHLLSAAAKSKIRATSGAPNRFSPSRAFLSLVQVRESCDKQIRGVIPF